MAPSRPTGPAPRTTARWQALRGLPGSTAHAHGSRCCTWSTCMSAFSAIVSGSTRTATSRSAGGTRCIQRSSSTTVSVMKPCRFLMPRSEKSPVKQKSCRPARHATHSACGHGRRTVVTTRSPRARRVTSGPTSTTCPSDSWPITRCSEPAGGVPYWKAQISRSVPHTPTSSMRSLTSVGAARRGGSCSISWTWRLPGTTATAFMHGSFRGTPRSCGFDATERARVSARRSYAVPADISTSWRAARQARALATLAAVGAPHGSGPRTSSAARPEPLEDGRRLDAELVRARLGEDLHRDLLRMLARGGAEQRMERAVVHGVQLVHHGREERRVRFERGDRGAERLGADVRVVLMQGEGDELREARRRRPEERREPAGDGHGRVAREQRREVRGRDLRRRRGRRRGGRRHGRWRGRGSVRPPEEPDRLQTAPVPEDQREVLLAEQAVEGVAERHGLELRAHRTGRARLAADLGTGLAAELVEDLGHRDVREPHRERVLLVADEPLGGGPPRPRTEQAAEHQHDRGGSRAPPPAAPCHGRASPPPRARTGHDAPPRAGGRAPRARRGWSGAAAASQPRPRTPGGDGVVRPGIIMSSMARASTGMGKPSGRLPPYGSTPGVLPPRVVNSVPHGLVDELLLASPLYDAIHS